MDNNIRNQHTDHLITPQNAVLVMIDYQPMLVNAVTSMDRSKMVSNAVLLVKLAKQFGMPVIASTVNASSDESNRLIPALRNELCGVEVTDRTSINAWEDARVREAIERSGRRKLVMAGLWTEACLTFPAVDALAEGYDVYPVVDAVGGTTAIAHLTGIRRMELAGAMPTTLVQFACELQRDWAREDTAEGLVGILREAGVFPRMD
ncbi:MAG: isochorismatase family protein [Rikenellaceae bacterium]|nr:isochorismatase family protein [Rikenellaceae bacterium]